jgi:hypothetical protein
MTLTEIIQDRASHCRGVTVEVNKRYGWVCIKDDAGKQEDIFFQGDSAVEFITKCERWWEEAGDVTEEECWLSEALDYVECLWE